MNHLNFIKLTVVALFISNTMFGQSLTDFKSLLEGCGMNVNIPSGYVESTIIANKDMEYDYALKAPNKDFELRYAIRPIKYKVYANDTVKKEMEANSSARNVSYDKNLKSVILNITGNVDYEFKVFDKSSVKEEFNADWGALTLVELKSTFGKGFKYCMIVAIHKDNVADAFYFYLAKTKENIPEDMKPLFHSLRFDE